MYLLNKYNYNYRRGNIEGNTRSRAGSRKDSKKSTNNQEDITLNTETRLILHIF